MKTCSQCIKRKKLIEFYKKERGHQGVDSVCKECVCFNARKRPKKPSHGKLYKEYLKEAGYPDNYVTSNRRHF